MKLLSICLVFFSTAAATAQSVKTARVRINASPVQNRVSRRMYASFVEMILQARSRGERNTFEAPLIIAPLTEELLCRQSCELLLPPDSMAVGTLRTTQ